MSDGGVRLAVNGPRADVTFDRPDARNAMTFAMYGELANICRDLARLPDLRVITFRGAGRAFVAGTDISEFTSFAGGPDGLAYERRVEDIVSAIETLPAPTIAVVDGPAVGGGLIIAAACDFRLATERARFGVPIARTLGNCLSARNVARLERSFGLARTRLMLLLGRIATADEALRDGFVLDVVPADQLEGTLDALVAELVANAPLTVSAGREVLRRLGQGRLDDDDIIARVYGSADFREGVSAFLGKRAARWSDRPERWSNEAEPD